MTITQNSKQANQPKPHIDGGTWRTIDSAETRNGWRITITEWTTYLGDIRFEVHRETPAAKLFRLGHFATEQEARAFANSQYRAEKYGTPIRAYIAA